jgi:hypothetical protein
VFTLCLITINIYFKNYALFAHTVIIIVLKSKRGKSVAPNGKIRNKNYDKNCQRMWNISTILISCTWELNLVLL